MKLTARPLPTIEQQEAYSFFQGWWYGVAVGSVIGAGLMAVILPLFGDV